MGFTGSHGQGMTLSVLLVLVLVPGYASSLCPSCHSVVCLHSTCQYLFTYLPLHPHLYHHAYLESNTFLSVPPNLQGTCKKKNYYYKFFSNTFWIPNLQSPSFTDPPFVSCLTITVNKNHLPFTELFKYFTFSSSSLGI